MAGPIDDFAALRARLHRLPPPDGSAAAAARARGDRLTKPPGSLGRLEELAVWAAAWQGRHPAGVDRPLVVIFAGEHGVAAAHRVSAYPPEVTRQMVANFAAGGAAINQLCRAAGARLRVVPLLDPGPTADMTAAPAMSETECARAFEAGFASLEPGTDLLAVGEMGIGNTTAAAALSAALFGGPAAAWVGPGTGLDPVGVARKAAVVEAALARHDEALGDPLEVLRRLGGRELAAIAGAVLAARLARVPVLLDGYVACAAAAVLHALEPSALDHCRAAHLSAEPAHARLIEQLGLGPPLLRLGMRLGEGSGAALAIPLVRAALACHAGMATFDEAGVTG